MQVAPHPTALDLELFLPNKPGTRGKHEKAGVGSGDSREGIRHNVKSTRKEIAVAPRSEAFEQQWGEDEQ